MYKIDNAGNVNIFIKAIDAVNLMGVSYAAGEVIANFENAYFALNFSNQNKNITKGPVNILNFNTIAVESISIDPKSLDYNHFNFIASSKSVDQNIYVPVKESITTDSTGVVFLIRIPFQAKGVIIKNSSNQIVTGYTIDYNTGRITSLGNSTTYTAYYYFQDVSLVGFSLKEIRTPYFKIEITGENNINGVSRFMFIEIPRASIDIATVLDFKNDMLVAPEMNFKILDGEASIIYY
jgi:hypothetical protein